NRRVDLHSEHPRQPQKGPAYPVDGFYAARTSTITGAPLVGFVTALHKFPLRAQKRLFDDADEFGIRHGVSVAIAGGFNRFAAFTFAVDEVSTAHGKMVTEANDIVQLIGLTFHAHADAKLALGSSRNEAVPLTQRERECLAWASRGKSMEATAMILGITPRAVKFHLDNARACLGADTLPQAVAIALRGRTIS
ncbi:LuxR family transcriptional regulator, partial [Bosea sp. (in: a-proteobacteria)]|uniref:helix-turn-helix transcriptional regulator n=1 Tax=Bosea sp. (in: a-proteobacteria) TaxID=1871050 RepID=UPI002735FDC7